ncbi:MAG TPA: hypothetical protein VFW98_16995 [Gemmatimonadaceae bacterium]|nr:hypothetical protein [Gemmatimonadaceae bacterium]
MTHVWERTASRHRRIAWLAVLCLAIGLPGRVDADAPRAPSVTGVYRLTRAAGGELPYAFSLDIGRPVHGKILGARLVLGQKGTYTSDVTVSMDWGDAFPIPGLSKDGGPQVFHSDGSYTTSGAAVVLAPSDWLTRRIVSRVLARTDGRTMTFTGADRPPDGQRYPLAAAFEKVK